MTSPYGPAAQAPPLRLYDTLSRSILPLVPRVAGHVRLYVCGMTVDGLPHLGHARSAVTFDVLVRRLEARGLRVTYVRNVTDVDDKIIARAKAEGVAPEAVVDRNRLADARVREALRVRPPDHEPRVTEHVGDIVALVARLLASGHAYARDGDVWFDVSTKADYGKLSRRALEDAREGTRVEADPRKRSAADFALWKAAKPGEPSWPAPWGAGRPGWHIECSAMSLALLGESFDVHGGGLDLVFPHHENELAQTEAATGVFPLASIWMHNGMLTRGLEKMAKSVGNVTTVEEVLRTHSPQALRAWFLSARYRSPLELSLDAVTEAGTALERLHRVLDRVARAGSTGAPPGQGAEEAVATAEREIAAALDDDLDTPRALAALYGAGTRLERAFGAPQAGSPPALADPKAPPRTLVDRLLVAAEPLGVLVDPPRAFLSEAHARRLAAQGIDPAAVDTEIAARTAARARGDFEGADAIKRRLEAMGVELRDGPTDTKWSVRAGGGIPGAPGREAH